MLPHLSGRIVRPKNRESIDAAVEPRLGESDSARSPHILKSTLAANIIKEIHLFPRLAPLSPRLARLSSPLLSPTSSHHRLPADSVSTSTSRIPPQIPDSPRRILAKSPKKSNLRTSVSPKEEESTRDTATKGAAEKEESTDTAKTLEHTRASELSTVGSHPDVDTTYGGEEAIDSTQEKCNSLAMETTTRVLVGSSPNATVGSRTPGGGPASSHSALNSEAPYCEAPTSPLRRLVDAVLQDSPTGPRGREESPRVKMTSPKNKNRNDDDRDKNDDDYDDEDGDDDHDKNEDKYDQQDSPRRSRFFARARRGEDGSHCSPPSSSLGWGWGGRHVEQDVHSELYAQHKRRIAELEKANKELEKTVGEMKKEMRFKEDENANLRLEEDKAKGHNEITIAQLNSVIGECSAKDDQILALKAEEAKAKSEIAALKSEIAALGSGIAEQEGAIENEFASLHEQLELARKQTQATLDKVHIMDEAFEREREQLEKTLEEAEDERENEKALALKLGKKVDKLKRVLMKMQPRDDANTRLLRAIEEDESPLPPIRPDAFGILNFQAGEYAGDGMEEETDLLIGEQIERQRATWEPRGGGSDESASTDDGVEGEDLFFLRRSGRKGELSSKQFRHSLSHSFWRIRRCFTAPREAG